MFFSENILYWFGAKEIFLITIYECWKIMFFNILKHYNMKVFYGQFYQVIIQILIYCSKWVR